MTKTLGPSFICPASQTFLLASTLPYDDNDASNKQSSFIMSTTQQDHDRKVGRDDDGNISSKRLKKTQSFDVNHADHGGVKNGGKFHPTTFVTWNCNGFTSRSKYDSDQLSRLVEQTQSPDMIFIQEARLKSSGSLFHQRGKPQDSELYGNGDGGSNVNDVLNSVFSDYVPVWSLSDTKYAGTLSLLHRRLFTERSVSSIPITGVSMTEFKKDPSSFAAFSPQSAIDLLLQKLKKTRKEFGLMTSTMSTTTVPSTREDQNVRQSSLKSYFSVAKKEGEGNVSFKNCVAKKKTQQTSLRSFFSPKKSRLDPIVNQEEGSASQPTSSISSQITIPQRLTLPRHHPEGRFQFFCFPDMDVLQTYVPNNGTKNESFEKRRQWDEGILKFIKDRKTILSSVTNGTSPSLPSLGDFSTDRPILWCGDLNVAADYRDGSHWERRSSDRSIYEWWKDESKCFVKSDNKGSGQKKRLEDTGIPSFTDAERSRFLEIVNEGDFCDVWRALYPNGDNTDKKGSSIWELPNYTWRGHLARGNYAAKYQGKGQRLDYFLLAPAKHVVQKTDMEQAGVRGGGKNGSHLQLMTVESCKILGYGEKREGLFCGSDHCAVQLQLTSLSQI